LITTGDPKTWGYLPHYQADIAGVFEIADRPDKTGKMPAPGRGGEAGQLGRRMDSLFRDRRRAVGRL